MPGPDGRRPLDPRSACRTLAPYPASRVPLAAHLASRVLEDVRHGRPWSLRALEAPRAPVALGQADPGLFAHAYPSVLDCCVKLPGDLELTIPVPLAPLADLLAFAAGVFRAHDPAYRARYLYLTVDQRLVPAGETHRVGGFHVDGLVGPRHGGALFPVCHQILVSDALPTHYAVQPFAVADLNLATTNLYRALDRQVDPARVIALPPRTMSWMNGHTVHACAAAPMATRRTFVRLEASMKAFDRLGNTPNPGLATPWAWVPRPIPEGLA